MKKYSMLILTVLLIIVGLVGCQSNSIAEKAIEQGKLAMADLGYNKALSSFELAINEGSKDDELKKIIKIIEDFNESKALIEEGNIEKAKKILNGIDQDYKNYAIKIDIDKLKKEIKQIEEENSEKDDAEKNNTEKNKVEPKSNVKSYDETISEMEHILNSEKEDIRKMYGEPIKLGDHGGGDSWIYEEMEILFTFVDFETFETKDVVGINIMNPKNIFGIEGRVTQENIRRALGKPESEGRDEYYNNSYVMYYTKGNLAWSFIGLDESANSLITIR